MRLGVVGTGWAANVQIPALRWHPGVEVVAVCSRTEANARAVAERFGLDFWTTDYTDLLDGRVDGIIVTTPPVFHKDMVLAAIAKGVHVLCEKPMAMNTAEARAMVSAAEAANVAAMMDFEFRYLPARALLGELLARNDIGIPQWVYATEFRSERRDAVATPWNWWSDAASGGGALGALGSHYVDALRTWFGEIKWVRGTLDTVVKERWRSESGQMSPVTSDDTFTLECILSSGTRATIHQSMALHAGITPELIVFGSEGRLRMVDNRRLFMVRHDQPEEELPIPDRLRMIPGGKHEEQIDWNNYLQASFLRLMDNFVEAARTGVMSGPTFEDGLKSQEVLDAVRESSNDGWVEIPG